MSKYNHVQSLRRSPVSDLRGVQKLECAAPLSRSQRSLIRADTERCNSRSHARRTVLATFGKLLRFFQKSLDLLLGALKKKSR